MDAANLKVWLPFDESTTLDKCGNTWTTTGSVSLDTVITKFGVASVHLPSGAYLKADNVIDLNADKWTFDGWAYCVSSTDDDGFLALSEGANRRGIIAANDGVWVAKAGGGSWQTSNKNLLFPSVKNQWVHLAIVKNGSTITFYQDGIAVWSFETSGLNNNGVFILGGASYGYGNDIYFDEVRFYEGTALWTENFTPPTAEDYVELALTMGDTALLTKTFDVQRKLSSRVEFTADVQRKIQSTWRYVNAGTADTLITTGTTLNNLPESKSVTGTAFYQTTREKCFDLPATDEIWIKFDVYFDGSNRWRAYNGGTNGITGITTQTDGRLGFFANDTERGHFNDVCIEEQLQTVLLHMISSSSSGVIEAWVDGTKIYRYTGDVNHGEDFADIYLQSDGSGTFFSNVVISNKQLTFGDGYTKLIADVQRKLSNNVEFTADVQRKVNNIITFAFDADIVIRDVLPVSSVVDVERRLTAQVEFSADIVIRDVFPFEFDADINRAIKGKVKLFAVDNTAYFPSGGTSSSGDSGTVLPVVIPPQETIPAAINNTIGLQSIEISLSEQQLTDNVAFTGVVPFDVMFPVQGQYLDYVFDMRVEHVTKKGVLYSCDCCIDIDQLLYTQIAYTVAPSTDWHTSGDSSTATTTSEVESVSAMYHALQLAAVLGKTPVIQFDDFQSTVLMENAGGVTYADMIRDIFGWSARVPTQMINVFVRNDKIFFVQRGHEARLIDLTLAKYTVPTVTHEIVRMTWGSTPWSKTETKETKSYRPPNTSTTSGNGAGIADIEENGGTAQVVHDEWFGQPESGYVNYTYNRKGLLIQSFTYVYNHETTQSTYTTVNHAYDTDGTLIYTGTFVQSMGVTHGSNYSSSNTEENKSYIKLPNGEKFLARESIVRYVGENSLTPTELAESKTIIHSPTRAGQSHTTIINDGETVGGIVGQNTGDDRVTPFSHYKAGSLSDSFKNSSGGAKTFDSIDNIESSGAYYFNRETGKWEKLNETVDTQSRTLNGLSLYDSSFPIHNVEKLVELTAAVQWLNRRTKETVNFTLYEYPHLIDFNDRIIFNGAEYFLVSNIATTNARVFNEQRISLVRWY